MKAKILWLSVIFLAFQTQVSADDRESASRAITQAFGRELIQALTSALETGGPTHAIRVCEQLAPQIATRLSAEHGATVSRTSLKVRRASNAPEPWQQTVLENFERRVADEDAATLEHFKSTTDGGARYMKAIVTQPLCVVCHGEAISPDVRRALDQRYPNDMATGFRAGDLRGAFSVVWPGRHAAH